MIMCEIPSCYGHDERKARTSEQARKAALARWGKRRRKARAKRSPNAERQRAGDSRYAERSCSARRTP